MVIPIMDKIPTIKRGRTPLISTTYVIKQIDVKGYGIASAKLLMCANFYHC